MVPSREPRGEQYVLSYHCVRLEAPNPAAMKSLQSGYFSRALMECVMRARQAPGVVRSDRGPEMVNKVNEEFLAICNVKHVLGRALLPGTKVWEIVVTKS